MFNSCENVGLGRGGQDSLCIYLNKSIATYLKIYFK